MIKKTTQSDSKMGNDACWRRYVGASLPALITPLFSMMCRRPLGFALILLPLASWPFGAAGTPLRFSAEPTVNELSQARIFDEPLVPIAGKPLQGENLALSEALASYAGRGNSEDFSSLTLFLDRFPNSPWAGSLLLHLATEYYNNGYYSRALDTWERAWQILKDARDPKGKSQVDRSAGELARMYSKLGRMGELRSLLNSITNRSLIGPGVQLLNSAQEALAMMQTQPGVCFRCGPMALDWILTDNDPAKASNPLILSSQSTTNGFSLSQVAEFSRQLGLDYQMAYRSPGAQLVVPAVIHWKVGHYAALLRQDASKLLVKDRTFQSSLWMSRLALDQESSGYFLIPPGPLPSGWRAVSEAEAQGIWGRGFINNHCTECPPPPPPPCPGGGGGDGGGGGAGGGCGEGLTTYAFHMARATLTLSDSPVGHAPPLGPDVYFRAAYNQNEANQPAVFYYSNLGPYWDFNWLTYVVDNPNSPASDVSIYVNGGGTVRFSGYDTNTHSYALETMSQTILLRTSNSSYLQQFRDGAKRVFAMSDGASGSSRRIFMTQLIDPAGNAVELRYDTSLRLTNIVDAIGQGTVFGYTNSNYPFAITSVQDPFGRTAYFSYNGSGLLSAITDVLGIISQYLYDGTGLVTNLTTPYGTTTFAGGTTNGTTWLQATDPIGGTELAMAPINPIFSAPSEPIPTNMPVAPFNGFLNYRNTYFWGKRAFDLGAGNPAAATIYHFLHAPDISTESSVLESVKSPLENRVWFSYQGQPQGNVLGAQSISRPIAVGRVLDDGSSQTSYYQYNSAGNITNRTDPIGRSFTYVYATNNVDLVQVFMTSHSNSELQTAITYSPQHRPLTVTDAAGQTTTNTYNARGQILSTTDPLGETTTFTYNSNGYLVAITGPLQTTNDVVKFTYDGFGRVQTMMETEGYSITNTYDAADRITRITHPDGTYEQFVYTNLDLAASADRLTRWTTNTYNANRQLVQTRDPLARITRFQYCTCGALEAMFDPAGNQTSWDHDVQSRVTAKRYADGSQILYSYEIAKSRLKSVVDEKGQTKNYAYGPDDNLIGISYGGAAVPTPAVTFTYDTNYNRRVTMQDGIGTTVYSYNPIAGTPAPGAGKLATVNGPLPNSLVTYQYDKLGRIRVRAINGVAQETSFDLLGRPSQVTNALGTFRYAYVGATARIASESYPNGQTNLYTYYNNAGDQRLLQIRHLYPNGSLLSGCGYSYNSVGKIIAWTNVWDNLPTRVWRSTYDAAGQLTNVLVLGGGSLVTNYAYAYDLAGNRTLIATNGVQTQFFYNPLNQLADSTTTLRNVRYEWDAENRLTAINLGMNRSEFAYDGLGRRIRIVEKTNGIVASSNYFLWCGAMLCEERDATGASARRRFFLGGESLVNTTNSGRYFYTKDHLRSVRETVDPNGTLTARYDYDPYGQRSTQFGGTAITFGYTGHFIHGPTGDYLAMYRALDSTIGRWLSRDPIAEQGGVNLYAYVANDPIDSIDPAGLCLLGDIPVYVPPNLDEQILVGAALLVGGIVVTAGAVIVAATIIEAAPVVIAATIEAAPAWASWGPAAVGGLTAALSNFTPSGTYDIQGWGGAFGALAGNWDDVQGVFSGGYNYVKGVYSGGLGARIVSGGGATGRYNNVNGGSGGAGTGGGSCP